MKKLIVTILLFCTVSAWALSINYTNGVVCGLNIGGFEIHPYSEGFSRDLYNFYVDFPSVTDRVLGNTLTTNLDATRYGYAGGTFGQDVPVIESGKALANGAYSVLNGKSNDIGDAYWTTSGSPIITGTDSFQATALIDRIWASVATLDSVIYTLSFYARVEPGGKLSGYDLYHADSASGSNTGITLTETRARYSVSVLGKAGGGPVYFGFRDRNTSDWAEVFINTINVTATPYTLPPTINTTTGILLVPRNNSIADEGIKAIGIAANFPQLLDALAGVAGGAELVTTNADFSQWSGDDPVDYTAGSETGTNFVTEHANGAQMIADGLSTVFRLTRDFTVEAAKNYKVTMQTSNYIDGDILLRLYDLSNSADILAKTAQTIVTKPTIEYSFTTPAGCTSLRVYNQPITPGISSFVIDSWSLKQRSPAKGRITIPWTPRFDAADVTGQINILTANDTAIGLLYYDANTNQLKAYDGVNTAIVACTPVNGTEYQIILDYGDNTGQKMRLMVDSTVGTAVTNAGSFPIVADLSIAWEADAPQEIGEIIIEKEPTW